MKKLISIMLCTAMLMSSANVLAEGTGASAAPSEWAFDYISRANGEFLPDVFSHKWFTPITRQQFCELAFNVIDKAGKAEAYKGGFGGEAPFSDTTDEKIIALKLMGIIDGKSEDTFAPNDTLTREEAAVILYRMAGYISDNTFSVTELYYVFDDADKISDWASEKIQIVCNMGLMQGTGSDFMPQKTLTLEEAVVILMRLYDKVMPFVLINANTFEDKLNTYMPKDKNYMFSPLSIKMALALAANGADGTTRDEILKTIEIDENDKLNNLDRFNKKAQTLIKAYQETDFMQVNIANSIWLNTDRTSQLFKHEYSDKVKEFYNAESRSVNNNNAVENINAWANEKTNGKIPSIINNNDFTAMLVNAVYFKASWQNDFNEGATKKDTFTNGDGTESQTDFMNNTKHYNYAKVNGAEIIELPYKRVSYKTGENGETVKETTNIWMSMYVVMHDDEVQNIQSIINTADFKSQFIKLSMPKFKFEYSAGLNDILKSMGISQAFKTDGSAHFEPMFTKDSMYISDVIHKTYIDVNEKGTEAAAITALAGGTTAAPPQPMEIKLNKPFTFVIKDTVHNEILFMGRYAFAK